MNTNITDRKTTDTTEQSSPAVELTPSERADLRARGRAEASRRFMVFVRHSFMHDEGHPDDAQSFVNEMPEGPYLERLAKAQEFADACNERHSELYRGMLPRVSLADGKAHVLDAIAGGRHALNIACSEIPAEDLAARVALALATLPSDQHKTEDLTWCAAWLTPAMRPRLRMLVALAEALAPVRDTA